MIRSIKNDEEIKIPAKIDVALRFNLCSSLQECQPPSYNREIRDTVLTLKPHVSFIYNELHYYKFNKFLKDTGNFYFFTIASGKISTTSLRGY